MYKVKVVSVSQSMTPKGKHIFIYTGGPSYKRQNSYVWYGIIVKKRPIVYKKKINKYIYE